MREKSRKYNDLVVWQKAHDLVLDIYRITKQYPKEELFGLTSQMRRAAISVPANIVEGFAKNGTKDKLRFYNIAAGSLNEVDYFLFLSEELGYAATSKVVIKLTEVSKILNKYTKTMMSEF